MSILDKMGMGPKREAVKNGKGWLVTVTPPEWSGCTASSLQLTDDQYARYVMWCDHGRLMQDAFPDLSRAEREILQTGISDDEFPYDEG